LDYSFHTKNVANRKKGEAKKKNKIEEQEEGNNHIATLSLSPIVLKPVRSGGLTRDQNRTGLKKLEKNKTRVDSVTWQNPVKN
jgi:hypothetical protein